MISAVVINLGDRVPGQKPHARILESAGFPNRFEQRRDLIAESESVTVEQFYRVENLAHGFFISPSGDVIPETGLHETAIRQEEAPDSLGPFTWRLRAGLRVNALGERPQI